MRITAGLVDHFELQCIILAYIGIMDIYLYLHKFLPSSGKIDRKNKINIMIYFKYE